MPGEQRLEVCDSGTDSRAGGEFAWTQTGQVSDLSIWDNHCAMHRRDRSAGHGRRRMHRLMTRGERPV